MTLQSAWQLAWRWLKSALQHPALWGAGLVVVLMVMALLAYFQPSTFQLSGELTSRALTMHLAQAYRDSPALPLSALHGHPVARIIGANRIAMEAAGEAGGSAAHLEAARLDLDEIHAAKGGVLALRWTGLTDTDEDASAPRPPLYQLDLRLASAPGRVMLGATGPGSIGVDGATPVILATGEAATVEAGRANDSPAPMRALLTSRWPLRLANLRIDQLRFGEEASGIDADPFVSAIEGGAVSVMGGTPIAVARGAAVTMQGFDGAGLAVTTDPNGLRILFSGRASQLWLGPAGSPQDYTPSMLAYLAQLPLMRDWLAAVALFGSFTTALATWLSWHKDRPKKPVAALLLLAGLPAAAHAQPYPSLSAQPAGERVALSFRDNVVRVITLKADGTDDAEGFGFVFGLRDGQAYVATADHVVRNPEPAAQVKVVLFHDQGQAYPAHLLDLRMPPAQGDLAVLTLPAVPALHPYWLPNVHLFELAPGARAWRIGKQERWVPAASPGVMVGLEDANFLAFDGLDTPQGSSGGPVVMEGGLVGMVVRDGGLSGLPSRVLPVDTIRAHLLNWQLPWNMPATDPPPRPNAMAETETALQRGVVSLEAQRLPGPPGRAGPSLAQDVRAFVLGYYASLSDPASVVLDRLRKVVADPVSFFGSIVPQAKYLADQARYFQRWPQRRFVVRPDSLTLRCDELGNTCQVNGTLDYDVGEPGSGRASTGSEDFQLLIHRTPDGFLIAQQGRPARAASLSGR